MRVRGKVKWGGVTIREPRGQENNVIQVTIREVLLRREHREKGRRGKTRGVRDKKKRKDAVINDAIR